MSGTSAGCLQDTKRSDPMDDFCQLFGVPRWLRQATRLMAGLEVALSGDMLVVKQVGQLGPAADDVKLCLSWCI
jgi:hypothetical protein